MRALKIDTDGTMDLVDIDPYDDLFGKGALIERVVIGDVKAEPPLRFENAVLIVDEDGIAKDLPLNPYASILYGADLHKSFIYGTAYVVGEAMTDDGVDFTDVPEEWNDANVRSFIGLHDGPLVRGE